jgi:hypothetical protein
MAYDSVLEDMKNDSQFQVDGIDKSTTQINEIKDRLNDQISSMENFLHTKASMIQDRLVWKRDNYFPGDLIYYGPTFDVTTATDWAIRDSITFVDVYVYHGVGWDGDSVIEDLVAKWNWGYKYLHESSGLNGTFGLYAKRDQLNASLTINVANRSQISQTDHMLS